MGGTVSALLQTVNAAVTPVVLISASAVLIMGVNNKHQAQADRLRALAADLRQANLTQIRFQCIQDQLKLFKKRYRYSKVAHLLLYMAVICYCFMVLILALYSKSVASDNAVLGLLLVGIMCTLSASVLEVFEVNIGEQTIAVELRSSMLEHDAREKTSS